MPHDFSTVRLLSIDIDGVATSGGITYSSDGRVISEIKTFSVHDGQGIVWIVADPDIEICVITGRGGTAVNRRCAELGIKRYHEGVKDKWAKMQEIMDRLGIDASQVCHIGDDFSDVPILSKIGHPVCVPNARPLVKDICTYCTQNPGGQGAVRDLIEAIFKSQGKFEAIISRYF